MKDQVDSLKENGIKAEFINSSQDIKTYTQTLRKIKRNEIKKYIKISFDTNYCLLMKNIIIK